MEKESPKREKERKKTMQETYFSYFWCASLPWRYSFGIFFFFILSFFLHPFFTFHFVLLLLLLLLNVVCCIVLVGYILVFYVLNFGNFFQALKIYLKYMQCMMGEGEKQFFFFVIPVWCWWWWLFLHSKLSLWL